MRRAITTEALLASCLQCKVVAETTTIILSLALHMTLLSLHNFEADALRLGLMDIYERSWSDPSKMTIIAFCNALGAVIPGATTATNE